MFPKLISVGSFFIPTYGVLVALGFLAGLFVTMRLARQRGLSPDVVTNLAVYCAIAGVLGAKLFMFLFDFNYYLNNPGEIFTMSTLQAAGVFHGGFIAAVVVAIFYMRRHKLDVSRRDAAGGASAICLGACASAPISPLRCRWISRCIRCSFMNRRRIWLSLPCFIGWLRASIVLAR